VHGPPPDGSARWVIRSRRVARVQFAIVPFMSILSSFNVPETAIAEFCRTWRVTEFALFGSVARGDARPDSDVDVMVGFAPESGRSLGDFVDMQDELRSLFGRDVDLVEKGSIRNPFRRRRIMRDLTVVYAA
jgi:uncharacterized protein